MAKILSKSMHLAGRSMGTLWAVFSSGDKANSSRPTKYFPFARYGRARSKGQMLAIAAIFMIIGFVMLRGLLSLPVLSQEKAFQDASYLDKSLGNIAAEYEYAASIAALQANVNRSGADYLSGISSYFRSEFDSGILYAYVFLNGSNGNFSVTLGNFLQNNISGVINFTNSTPPGRAFNINDSTNVTLEFNSSSAWINATLNYTLNGRETVERFYFNSSSRHYVAEFYEVTLRQSGFTARTKGFYNRTWIDTA